MFDNKLLIFIIIILFIVSILSICFVSVVSIKEETIRVAIKKGYTIDNIIQLKEK